MLWAVLGMINGKTLLIATVVGVVAFVVTHWPHQDQEEDDE